MYLKLIAFIQFIVLASSCSTPMNSPDRMKQVPLILISVDGYRYDYTQLFKPPHLSEISSTGVRSLGLISSFPTKTFPNHYSIVTGLRPHSHGIVSNFFYDPVKKEDYAMTKKDTIIDGSWYKGTPIWNLAREHGMVSASYFWVGSEAKIQNFRPHYYKNYDSSVPNEKRVDQVVDWLSKDELEAPKVVTMYFSDVDRAGHRYGPESSQVKEAVYKVDEAIGRLKKKLKKLNKKFNLIIVSDHGMAEVNPNLIVKLDDHISLNQFKIVGKGTIIQLYKKSNTVNIKRTIKKLNLIDGVIAINPKSPPKSIKIANNDRFGDIVIMAKIHYAIFPTKKQMKRGVGGGSHGHHPRNRLMHGIFYANGPAFKNKLTIGRFENIHIYPLLAKLLNLPIAHRIDGKFSVLKGILK